MSEQAKQTPLVELLDAVPEDVRIGVQDSEDWNAGTTWHPVGRLCRDAAAELRRLHAVNQELLEALRLTSIDCQYLHHAHKDRHLLFEECPVVARINAAIAKAEAQP
jgi:hypothetical protein